MMHLAIVIPAYNEGKVIKKVIDSLPRKLSHIEKISVIVVNDGSVDDTVLEIKKTKAILLNHIVNLGYGSATITGLETAKKIEADIAVTFDGDGQHDPRDIAAIIRPIIEGKADLVIGSRLLNAKEMPWIKKIGNWFLNFVTRVLSGYKTSDSQSGFKVFSRYALSKFNLDTMGYEICSEIIMEAARNKLKIKEIPIKTIYSNYSKKKGQSIINGINIVGKLIARRIRG